MCIISTVYNAIYEIRLEADGLDHYYLDLNKNYNFEVTPPVLVSAKQ